MSCCITCYTTAGIHYTLYIIQYTIYMLRQVQLLVRNDTTMGTVVLNTLLYESIPITRSGRNGIMIVVSDAVSFRQSCPFRSGKLCYSKSFSFK